MIEIKNQMVYTMPLFSGDKQWMVAGIDIGGTNTVVGIVDYDKNLIYENSFLTCPEEGVDKFVKRLTLQIKAAYTKFQTSHQLKGIGIAAPGANYLTGILESPVNLKWGRVDIVLRVEKEFATPVVLINDAHSAALGEQEFGSAKEMKNFIAITIGTGLGAGIILNGKLYRGENGHAGEIGHTIIEDNGRQCSCGRKGCL